MASLAMDQANVLKAHIIRQLTAAGVSTRACLAEFVGMTVFIALACGTAVGLSTLAVDDAGLFDKGVHVIGTAMAFGFTIAALAYSTAHTSGGQFNPAVSISLVLANQLPLVQCFANIAMQVLGAIVGSFIVEFMFPNGGDGTGLGSNGVPDNSTAGRAFVGEMVGTFALVFVVLETACNPKSIAGTMAPLPIGLTVFVVHLLLIPFTSCSINPARSLGPAIVSNTFGNHFWVFMVAPLVGGILATIFHLFFLSDWDTVHKEGVNFKQDYMSETEDLVKQMAAQMGISSSKKVAAMPKNKTTNELDSVKVEAAA